MSESKVGFFAEKMAAVGFDRFRIWTCACGQKNRVDAAKVIGLASQAWCGKCGSVLKAPHVDRK